jgi:1-phosphofructokinase family hexose kinase
MIAVLSLNPAIDKIVSVQGLRWGKHIQVKNVKQVAAGKGINAARVIKRLGGKAIIIGVAGGPNGEWIKNELKKEKIKFDFVSIRENIRQNLTVMDEYRDREFHLREETSLMNKQEVGLIRKKLKKWSSGLSLLVISGRAMKGIPVNFYKEIITFFRKKNIPVLLDANGPAFVEAMKAVPDYIKPNLNELEELAGRKLRGKGEEIDFIRYLLRRGINTVMVTKGPGEAVAMNSKQGLTLTPPRVKIKNTVGCGDAVTGALAYGLSRGIEFKRMLKLAIACGSANALSPGPGFLNKEKVNSLTRKVNVKVLYNYCD